MDAANTSAFSIRKSLSGSWVILSYHAFVAIGMVGGTIGNAPTIDVNLYGTPNVSAVMVRLGGIFKHEGR